MDNLRVIDVVSWVERAPRQDKYFSGIIAVAAKGAARERRKTARSLCLAFGARYLSVADNEQWLRAAPQVVRDLESGVPAVVELSRNVPTQLRQFLFDLERFGAVEVLQPRATRTATVRCASRAAVIVVLPTEGISDLIRSHRDREAFELVVRL
jgi:hypothetical protein